VRIFEQDFALEVTLDPNAFAPLEVNMRVANSIPLGYPLPLTVSTMNYVEPQGTPSIP
jgi:hypothetical protein